MHRRPGPCEPSFVQQRSLLQVTPIAYRLADTTPELPRRCAAEWLGHSRFLLNLPTGTRMLRIHTRSMGSVRLRSRTISNLHVTHSDVPWIHGNRGCCGA